MKKVFVVIENVDGFDEVRKVFANEAPALIYMDEVRSESRGENDVCVVPMEVE